MPTIDIPNKICPHCGGTKWFEYKAKYKDKIYIKYSCLLKVKENHKQFKKNNPDKVKDYRKKSHLKNREYYLIKSKNYNIIWYQKNKENVIKQSKKWKQSNLEKHKQIRKKMDKKASDNLSDRYVKSILCDDTLLKHSDISQELIELKREQLLLKRQIKQNEKENKCSDNSDQNCNS
jgi:hypothetical protein